MPTDDGPAVYIVRDGRESLVSYAHYISSFRYQPKWWESVASSFGYSSFNRILKKLIVDKEYGGGWSGNVKGWTWERTNGLTVLVKYEQLKETPLEILETIPDQLEFDMLPVSNRLPNFNELQSKWPNFFRKGEADSWRYEMSASIQAKFWRHHSDAMRAMGYTQA